MCGIIGYCGPKAPLPILLSGLHALEYRGYDSSGVAVLCDGKITCKRASGRISALEEALASTPGDFTEGKETASIGHTRWATHGRPEERNAHPHSAGMVTLVHNGIIENHELLHLELSCEGREFLSDTDTEAAAHLIDRYYSTVSLPNGVNNELGLAEKEERASLAILLACREIKGSFAFGILFKDIPGRLFSIRRDSPLIVSKGDGECFIASDVTALLGKCKRFFRLDPGVLAICAPDRLLCLSLNGDEKLTPVEQKDEEIRWSAEQAKKGGFKHFMIKEIHESAEAIRKTTLPRLSEGLPFFGIPFIDSGELFSLLSSGGRIHIVACGTAYHAGLIGKTLIERYARIPVSVEIASEFRYREPILSKNDCLILLSQSGETADTLASLRYAKELGVRTVSIVNVYGSTVARESDDTIYTLAGPEIAVASTKAYSVQCACLALLALRLGLDSDRITEHEARKICSIISNSVPASVSEALKMSDKVKEICSDPHVCHSEHVFYIGRGVDNDLCVEGALKLKEISYIHCEAYAAGELKHGTISLITEGTPVLALITDKKLYEKTLSAIREVKSRGALVIALISKHIIDEEKNRGLSVPADILIEVPSVFDNNDKNESRLEDLCRALELFPAACILQLFAYHSADALGHDVDMPRNLAKSVTVE